jgi:ketosteroid isomerase-like protein
MTKSGLAQPQPGDVKLNWVFVESMVARKAFNDLIQTALTNQDTELRRLAVIRLTEMEGDGSVAAMVELYNKSEDPDVKQLLISAFRKISEIEPLVKIALSDPSPEFRERALAEIKWLKENSDSGDIKAWDVSALQDRLDKLPSMPPPPPPPPPPGEQMTVEAGKELKTLRWHKDDDSIFALLRQAADAGIRRDTSFHERFLDEDYIETGPNGETLNKAQAIADVKRLDHTFKKFEFDDLSVSGTEQMSMATFLGTVYYEANGQDSTAQYRYTVNFIKRDGQWKIAAIHMSRKS